MKALNNAPFRQIVCQDCGEVASRAGQTARFCHPCSEKRSVERKARWGRDNADSVRERNKDAARERRPRIKSAIVQVGQQLSSSESLSFLSPSPDFLWVVRFRVPFSYSASKNHIYGLGHHVHKRKQSREIEDVIALATRSALKGQKIVQNKLWVGLHVEKPDHKGDGINVVDLVCDGIKVGAGIDDRWFCLSFLDWSINKRDPFIIIQIGQESDVDVQACSHCGRLLTFDQFHRKANTKHGIDRACRECRSAASREAAR